MHCFYLKNTETWNVKNNRKHCLRRICFTGFSEGDSQLCCDRKRLSPCINSRTQPSTAALVLPYRRTPAAEAASPQRQTRNLQQLSSDAFGHTSPKCQQRDKRVFACISENTFKSEYGNIWKTVLRACCSTQTLAGTPKPRQPCARCPFCCSSYKRLQQRERKQRKPLLISGSDT